MSPRLKGMVLTLLSGAAFGSMSTFTKLVYAEGVSPSTLLFLRFVMASACLFPLVYFKRIPLPKGQALIAYIVMGGLCYTLEAQAFFIALQYASAGLVALLLYLYPAFVMILSALFLKEQITRRKLIVLLLTSLGLVITVGLDDHRGSLIGISLAVGAALVYALYSLIGQRFGGDTHPMAAAFVVMLSAAVSHAGLVAVTGWHPPVSAQGWGALLAIALLCTVVAIIFYLMGIALLGATQASLISTVEPVVTLLLAGWVLGEQASFLQWVGGSLILAGVALLAIQLPVKRAVLRDIHE